MTIDEIYDVLIVMHDTADKVRYLLDVTLRQMTCNEVRWFIYLLLRRTPLKPLDVKYRSTLPIQLHSWTKVTQARYIRSMDNVHG